MTTQQKTTAEKLPSDAKPNSTRQAADCWQALYPFERHSFAPGSNESADKRIEMNYVDEGNGAPLLFVHGNPTWSFYWRELIRAFSKSHRCLAVDHVGCGLSDKPQSYNYTLSQHVANLTQFVDRLGLDEITLVAHDWGGAIGLGAVLQRPDRFSKLVLLNTAGFPPPYIPWRIRACRIPLIGTLAIRGLNLFSLAALRMAVEKRHTLDRATRSGLIAPYDSWRHRVAVDRFVKDIPTSAHHATWQLLEKIESHLSHWRDKPTQLIWGMKDWCFRPSCITRFQSHLPEARVEKIENAGHYVVEEAPQRVIDTIQQFLNHSS